MVRFIVLLQLMQSLSASSLGSIMRGASLPSYTCKPLTLLDPTVPDSEPVLRTTTATRAILAPFSV